MVVFGKLVEAPRQLLWPSLALIAALLLLALVVALIDRWRKPRSPAERLTTQDQLAHFRTLYERGELSPEEYGRIHGVLAERLKKEIDELGTSSAAPTEPNAPAPSPKGKGEQAPIPFRGGAGGEVTGGDVG